MPQATQTMLFITTCPRPGNCHKQLANVRKRKPFPPNSSLSWAQELDIPHPRPGSPSSIQGYSFLILSVLISFSSSSSAWEPIISPHCHLETFHFPHSFLPVLCPGDILYLCPTGLLFLPCVTEPSIFPIFSLRGLILPIFSRRDPRSAHPQTKGSALCQCSDSHSLLSLTQESPISLSGF